MRKILLVLLLFVSGYAVAQSNYIPYQSRNRWIAGKFDSTLHIPKGATPGLYTGGYNSSGALFYKTSDSTVYVYTGTQWISVKGTGSGSADSTIFATLYRLDTAKNNIRASIGAKADSGTVWKRTGNGGTSGTDFIGTTDVNPIRFKINNIPAGYISASDGLPYPVSDGGSVRLGQYAGVNLGDTNELSTLIGYGAGYSLKSSAGGQSVMIGNWAGFLTDSTTDAFGNRSVLIGQSAAFRNKAGASLTYVGTFAGEMNNIGTSNTGIGRDAMRSNVDGGSNTGVGLFSLLYNTTGIGTIEVTNPGSGYTSATVTISAPPTGPPGTYYETATATAVIDGGEITAITITNPGGGYSLINGAFHTGITVTITGDGVGATASVTETISGNYNTGIGAGAGMYGKRGTGNTSLGYLASWRADDNYMTLLGYGTGVGTGAPTTMTNAGAIGYDAKVSASNTIAIGKANTKVVVGGETTTAGFEVVNSNGAIIDSIGIDAKGLYSGEQTSMSFGIGAMKNASGTHSTAVGYKSQEIPGSSSNSAHNTSVGTYALRRVNQFGNSAFGSNSGTNIYNGYRNTAIGAYANYLDSNGSSNTGVGFWALNSVKGNDIYSGAFNSALGDGAGASVTTGSRNTALGAYSMGLSTLSYFPGSAQLTGSNNTGVGVGSLFNLSSGSDNIGIGYNSGINITTGSYNVIIGSNTGSSIATANRRILISDGEGNIRLSFDSAGNGLFTGTGGTRMNIGNTSQRPTAAAGLIRWNTDSSAFEYSNGSTWTMFGSGSAASLTVGTFNSQTPSVDGAVISGNNLYLQLFGAEVPGLVPSGGDNTTFLRGDGTWQAVSGGGLTKGTTTIASSATRRILYDSSGVLSNNANFIYNSSGELIVGGTTDNGSYVFQSNGNAYFSNNIYTGGSILEMGNSSRVNFGGAGSNPSILANSTSIFAAKRDNSDYVDFTAKSITATNTITTGNPGSGAGAWKLGTAVTTSGLTLNTTTYVEVSIGGTVYRLAVVDPPQP